MSKPLSLTHLVNLQPSGADIAIELEKHAVLTTEPTAPVVLIDEPKPLELQRGFTFLSETSLRNYHKQLTVAQKHIKKPPITGTRPPSRNKPCPCGSTRKYKHCCSK